MKYRKAGFLGVTALFIAILMICWAVGNFVNIDMIALIIYVLYMAYIYKRDINYIIEYSWLIIMSSMSIVGVFACEMGSYLPELEMMSEYFNCLCPFIILHVLMFSVMEMRRSRKYFNQVKGSSEKVKRRNNAQFASIVLFVGIAMLAFLFLRVANRPFFSLGAARIIYMQDFMAPLDRSLKSYLPFFIPVAIYCWKINRKKSAICFFLLLVLYYFWTGDKFGAFFFAIYIVILSSTQNLNKKLMSRISVSLVACVMLLLGVVYIQRVLLYQDSISIVVEYILARLSAQGQVWWSVCKQFANGPLHLGEFADEIFVILPGSSIDPYTQGQWKMMLVAAEYTDYVRYRVSIANPFTETTAASLLYYFGWAGVGLFYILVGLFYGNVIRRARIAMGSDRLLESMVLVKIISCVHSLIGASDLYIFSYKGLFYIAVYMGLVYLRKKNIRLKLCGIYIA